VRRDLERSESRLIDVALIVERTGVDEHPDRLFEEERVPGGAIEELAKGAFRSAHERLQQRAAVIIAERFERDRSALPVCGDDAWFLFQELRASAGDDEDRSVSAGVKEREHEIDERLFGPVEIFEDEDQRPLPGHELEDAPDTPVELAFRDLSGLVRAARRRGG